MADRISDRLTSEPNSIVGHFPLVSWRSILAGFLVSLFTYAVLLCLGIGAGGISLHEAVRQGEGGQGLAIGTGIWILISTLISLFAGAYFAARVSNFITRRIGAAQGVVIGSLFFLLMLAQIGSALAWMGRGAGAAVNSLSGAAADLSQDPRVQDTIERALAGRPLRSDPGTVAQGLVTRLMHGNRESAKNYLAYQAGLSPAEADQRLAQIQDDFNTALQNAATSMAKAVSAAGWSLFLMLVLGASSAAAGGAAGAQANSRRPLAKEAGAMAGGWAHTPTFQP